MELRAFQAFKNLGLEAQVYVLLFVAIVFSGSLYGRIVPYLILLEIGLLLWMSAAMPGKKVSASVSGRGLMQVGILLVFCLFLFWQVSFAHSPAITQVYVQRFLIFAVLLVLVPRLDVCVCAIKASKHYAFWVAASIILLAIATGERTGGLVGNHQFGGMMMSIACILFLIDYFEEGARRVDAIGFALALAALFVSGKRMFTLLAALAFVFLYLLSLKQKGSTRAARLLLVGATLITPLYLFVQPVRELVMRMGLLSLDEYAATSGRNLLWSAASEIFSTHTIVGIGFGNFPAYISESFYMQGVGEFLTHNIYYGLLAETGLVGFVLIVGLMAVSFVQSWRLLRGMRSLGDVAGRYVMTFSVSMQAWFIAYGFSGNGIYDWHEFFFYISAVAMMVSVSVRVATSKNPVSAVHRVRGEPV